jgi:hypothetical protein
MRILSHPQNDDADFGKAVFHVGDFLSWLCIKRLRICTMPNIADFEFVQAASLLQAVERAAATIDQEEARQIVMADPVLASDRMAEIDPKWLVAAEAHRKWRLVIKAGIEARELDLLDYASKLPLSRHTKLQDDRNDDRAEVWKSKAQAMAIALYEAKPAKKMAIAGDIAKAFQDLGILSSTGKPLTAENIARQALTPWTAPIAVREKKKRK